MSSELPEVDELEDEILEGLALDGASLEKRTFTDCIFRDCTFVEATLRRCLFESCTFERCEMTMLSPYDTSFRETAFERCKLMGIDWTRAHQLTFDVRFSGCVLSYCVFDAMSLQELSMTDCKAIEAVFSDADLSGADLSGTDLSGAVFHHTKLERADLSLATGYDIDPRTNTLRDTRFALDAALRSMALLGITVPAVDAG